MRVTSSKRKLNLWAAAVGLVAAGVLTPVAIASATSAPTVHSKGPIPESAWGANGQLDMSKVPDFIPALDQAGALVGYIDKKLAMPPDGNRPPPAAIPVYASDLKSVVGRMVPGKGFVAAGKPDSSVPDIPVTGVAATASSPG